jgi:hypothetical protein
MSGSSSSRDPYNAHANDLTQYDFGTWVQRTQKDQNDFRSSKIASNFTSEELDALQTARKSTINDRYLINKGGAIKDVTGVVKAFNSWQEANRAEDKMVGNYDGLANSQRGRADTILTGPGAEDTSLLSYPINGPLVKANDPLKKKPSY